MSRPLALPTLVVMVFCAACQMSTPRPSDDPPQVAIAVGATGYEPSEVTAAAGAPVRLVFTRTTDEGCGQQLVFPDLGIRRDLPLEEPVAVDVTMPASGSVTFTCGMAMYRGAVVAR